MAMRDSTRKGDRHLLPERPEGCFAQKVPVTFSLPRIVQCRLDRLPRASTSAKTDAPGNCRLAPERTLP
jgi:hypothetical protein